MTLSGNTQVERQEISLVVEGVRCDVCKILSLIRMLSRRNVSWGTKVGLVRRWGDWKYDEGVLCTSCS